MLIDRVVFQSVSLSLEQSVFRNLGNRCSTAAAAAAGTLVHNCHLPDCFGAGSVCLTAADLSCSLSQTGHTFVFESRELLWCSAFGTTTTTASAAAALGVRANDADVALIESN